MKRQLGAPGSPYQLEQNNIPCQDIADSEPSESFGIHSAQPCYFMELSGEMMSHVLQWLDNVHLIKCAQVSRILNLLAVQAVLDRQKIWRPTYFCTIVITSQPARQPDGILSALLISVHITKFYILKVYISGVTSNSNWNLDKPLEQALRLFQKAESVKDVSITLQNTPRIPGVTPDKKLKSLCRAFEALLTTILLKGCSTGSWGARGQSPIPLAKGRGL